MLRVILGVPRRNEDIRRMLELAPIDEVIRSGRLVDLDNVHRRDANKVTRRVVDHTIQATRVRRKDMAPTDHGRRDGCGCYIGYGPRRTVVEKEDNADPMR